MSGEMSAELRSMVLMQAPADVVTALGRVHAWGAASSSIREKIAVDDLLTFVARLMLDNQSMAGELDELRWRLGIDDEEEAAAR